MAKDKSKSFFSFLLKEAKKDKNESLLDKANVFFRMVGSMIRGEYKGFSKKNAILGVVTLIWVISPIDLDFIPFIGWVDDLAVFAYFLSKLNEEVDKFATWEDNNQSDKIIVQEDE